MTRAFHIDKISLMLRIALAQINPTVGDLSGNRDKLLRLIKVAEEKGGDILIFPEMSLTGYPPEDLLLKPHFLDNCHKLIEEVSKNTGNILTFVGFPRIKGGCLYNACACIYKGKTVGLYYKRKLPNYGVFDERRYFDEGNTPLLLHYGEVKIGVTICEDIWNEAEPAKDTVKFGIDLLINLSASPYHFGKVHERKKLVRDFAIHNKVVIAYCNQVGGQDELIFDGGSFICDRSGKFVLEGALFKEELLFKDVEFKKARSGIAKRSGSWIKLKPQPKEKRIPLSSSPVKHMGVEEEVYEALILGIRDYVRKNGFSKVALGLSGGIDSALVAVLACDALGAENVYCISMPSPISSPDPLKDTKSIARNLGVKLITLPIENIYNSYLDLLRGSFKGRKADITEENIQARIRGNILMALSNKFGWLILTTGNKSEMSVGYATLYGDMAGGFAVLKDVYKTLVYRLVNFRNKKGGGEVIPKSVIERAPTAELRPGQRDEDTLPPYPTLDKILHLYIEKDMSFDAIIQKGFSREITRDVIHRVDRNEYKRRQSPPGIKITPKAFGKDRRMPITNAYREEQK